MAIKDLGINFNLTKILLIFLIPTVSTLDSPFYFLCVQEQGLSSSKNTCSEMYVHTSEAMTPETIFLMLCNIDTLLIKTGGYSISLNSILNESSAFPEIHRHNLYLQIVLFVSSFTLPTTLIFLPYYALSAISMWRLKHKDSITTIWLDFLYRSF